jgi:hypothetical protein
VTKQELPGKFEIGRILHLKFEIRKLRVDWRNRAPAAIPPHRIQRPRPRNLGDRIQETGFGRVAFCATAGEVTKQARPGKFEIGRILHLKFEIRKLNWTEFNVL